MKRYKGEPILLTTQSEDAYLDPQAPIFLLPNSDVQCEGEIYKAAGQSKHQYRFIRDYLKKKRLPFDISSIRYKHLIDVIEELRDKNKKSISLNKLRDIVVFNNQIARIKEYKIGQIKHVAYIRFWKKRKQLLREKKYKKVAVQQHEFERRAKIVHQLINKL